ncbi:MULE domain-containing protein, partial [Aphis craccivora]
NAVAATLYPWPVAEILMRKARRKVMPVLPSSLNELANFLDFNVQRYTCCQQPFYQDKVTDTHGKSSIIFACSKLIRTIVMLGSNELHADATFKVVPSTPPSRQLFIMHLIYQNHSIPIVYALMESKTEEAYTLLLKKCKELFPFLMPLNIMTDFESGLLNAFKFVYPDADQHSCWFHYVQALVKNIRKRGLTRFVKSNLNAQRCVQMFSALALLPNNKIDEGYTVIRQYARDNNIFMDMAPFFNYFSRYWLNNQNGGDYLFSVHGIARRTNNNIESFHGRLKDKFQVMHPNLWTFLSEYID